MLKTIDARSLILPFNNGNVCHQDFGEDPVSLPAMVGHRGFYGPNMTEFSDVDRILMTAGIEGLGAEVDISLVGEDLVIAHDAHANTLDEFEAKNGEAMTLPSLVDLYLKDRFKDRILFLDIKKFENDDFEVDYLELMRLLKPLGERAILCTRDNKVIRKLIVAKEIARFTGQSELPGIDMLLPDPVFTGMQGFKAKDEFMPYEEMSKICDDIGVENPFTQDQFAKVKSNFSPDYVHLCYVNAFSDYVAFGTFLGKRFRESSSNFLPLREFLDLRRKGVKGIATIPNIPLFKELYEYRVKLFHSYAKKLGYKIVASSTSSIREMRKLSRNGADILMPNIPDNPYLNPKATEADKTAYLQDSTTYSEGLRRKGTNLREELKKEGFVFNKHNANLVRGKNKNDSGLASDNPFDSIPLLLRRNIAFA